jgi:hypothetical protein
MMSPRVPLATEAGSQSVWEGAGRIPLRNGHDFRARFTTAASLAHELIEARDEKRLMRFQLAARRIRTADCRFM